MIDNKFAIFSYRAPFKIKDYERFDKENREVLLVEKDDPNAILESLHDRVVAAIKGKKYLPICRFADGEYLFLFGFKSYNLRKSFLRIVYDYLKNNIRVIFKGSTLVANTLPGVSSGTYSSFERKKNKEIFFEFFQHLSGNGIIALYTIIKPNFYFEQYLQRLEKIFIKKKIKITEFNYVPFYLIYILLTNKKFSDIFAERRILLITTFDKEKKKLIENSLQLKNVKSIDWFYISPSKSLYEKLDTSTISADNYDIIFIGAGIGKPNIFMQLKKFNGPIIDAGFVFEIWNNKDVANRRDYCLTDIELKEIKE